MSEKLTTAEAEWFTVREVAQRWRVSAGVVYTLLEGSALAAKKIGGSWRVHKTALAAYEADGIPKDRRAAERFKLGERDALGRKAKASA